MIATTLEYQLTRNIGAGEEVRFSFEEKGVYIRRIHGTKELECVIDRMKLDLMRQQLVDEYLGEILWRMAITLRSN